MVIPTSITQQTGIGDVTTQIFDVNIFGQTVVTTVTSNHLAVTEWINTVYADRNSGPRHIGFEIEVEQSPTSTSIGTVQFCYGNQCLVFQLLMTRQCPASLDQFLGDNNNIFLGTHTLWKMDILYQRIPFSYGVCCKDLREYPPELTEVRKILLDSIRLHGLETDWTRPFYLSLQQVHFACIDAFLNLHMARLFGVA